MSNAPPAPENGEGWVVMFHPDLDPADGNRQYAEVPRETYDLVWEEKGWKMVTPEERAKSLTSLGKEELQARAREAGLDDSGTKAEIIARLGGDG